MVTTTAKFSIYVFWILKKLSETLFLCYNIKQILKVKELHL